MHPLHHCIVPIEAVFDVREPMLGVSVLQQPISERVVLEKEEMLEKNAVSRYAVVKDEDEIWHNCKERCDAQSRLSQTHKECWVPNCIDLTA